MVFPAQQPAGDNESNQADSTSISQLLHTLILEIRSMRLAVVAMACNEKDCKPNDFDPQTLFLQNDNDNDG